MEPPLNPPLLRLLLFRHSAPVICVHVTLIVVSLATPFNLGGCGPGVAGETTHWVVSSPDPTLSRGKGSGVYRALSWAFPFYESGDFL